MRATIEDGVYNLVIEVKIDNGKGRMIQRTDIFFQFVWVCGGIWWGLEDEQVN